MTGKMKSAAVVFVLIMIALGVNWTCSNGHATPTGSTDVPDVKGLEGDIAANVQITRDTEKIPYGTIPPIKVRRGERIVFAPPVDGTAFLLFPNPYLVRVVDGVEEAARGGFVAFMVGNGAGGVLRVPRSFPASEQSIEIPYSVLACTGQGADMKCQYVEGNSPPIFIIPPGG